METNSGTAVAKPHFAIFPCSGMGHLLPFLRLATMLNSQGVAVTVIVPYPTVSAAESDQLSHFFTSFPSINRLDFHLPPHKKSTLKNEDPFFIQMESICNSVHLLFPHLISLSPPISAIVSDFVVTAVVSEIASTHSIPVYTQITTSGTFFTVMSQLPQILQRKLKVEQDSDFSDSHLSEFTKIPISNIPPPMLDPNHFFSSNIVKNSSSLHKSKGILNEIGIKVPNIGRAAGVTVIGNH